MPQTGCDVPVPRRYWLDWLAVVSSPVSGMTAAVRRLQVLGHELTGDGASPMAGATGLAGRCRTFRVVNPLDMFVSAAAADARTASQAG